MPSYSEWEEAVTSRIAAELTVSNSDAAALVEGQAFSVQQAWGLGLTADNAAAKILAGATQPGRATPPKPRRSRM